MSDQAQAEPPEGPAGGVALVTGASGALGAVAVEVLAVQNSVVDENGSLLRSYVFWNVW